MTAEPTAQPMLPTPPAGSAAALPTVTVILPVLNEAEYIEACIRSLQQNTYPPELVEILVVDGGSTDATRTLVERLAAADARIRLLDNPRRLQAAAVNIGIQAARGEILIRLDGHATAAPDYLAECVAGLQARPEAWCVGGPITTVSSGYVGRVIAACMSSPVGVGNARFRTGNFEGEVDTVAFGAYRRTAFDRVGLLDEDLPRTEDDDLHFRMRAAGGRIYMTPRIRTTYYARGSLGKLWRQYYQYGYWRIPTMMKHGTPATLRQVIPLLFVLTWLVLLLGAVLWTPLGYVLGAFGLVYVLGLLAGASGVARRHGLAAGLLAPLVFAILHFAYGLGSLHGVWAFYLFRGRYARRAKDEALTR